MQRIVGIFLSIFIFMAAWGAAMTGQIEALKDLTSAQMKVVSIVRESKTAPLPPRCCAVSWRVQPSDRDSTLNGRAPQAPLYVVMLFGTYSLASIGIGLITFKDCPEESELLKGEVKEAMAELRAKGVYPKSD
jgi:hypothetical protein